MGKGLIKRSQSPLHNPFEHLFHLIDGIILKYQTTSNDAQNRYI